MKMILAVMIKKKVAMRKRSSKFHWQEAKDKNKGVMMKKVMNSLKFLKLSIRCWTIRSKNQKAKIHRMKKKLWKIDTHEKNMIVREQ